MIIEVPQSSIKYTQKAYGIKHNDGLMLWLPRSQVGYKRSDGGDMVELDVPHWLAKQYNFFAWYKF